MVTATASPHVEGTGIGAAVKRREDFRFLKGLGRYTDDMTMPNMTHCVFVRSPVAHAKLGKIDLTAAKNSPGVVLCYAQRAHASCT